MADVIEWEAKSSKMCQGPQGKRAESERDVVLKGTAF